MSDDSAQDVVAWSIRTYGPKLALATSFQKEGMVIIDMAARVDPAIRVFTLDTGRLPEETYQMIETVRQRYGIAIELVAPDPVELQSMVSQHGLDLFRRDVPSRMLCCHIRKVRPMARKLTEFRAYLVGLRREQNESRADVEQIAEGDGLTKISPLAEWTQREVDDYTARHRVPVHPLYAQGYSSIGCAPCTRAIQAGEPDRAGRWWWEQEADKECGIHFSPDGRAERQVDVLLRDVLAGHAILNPGV
jgi:phosphoadenylyl-sulfate reductase (thioredoxin)